MQAYDDPNEQRCRYCGMPAVGCDCGVQMETRVWPDGTIAKAWFDGSRKYRYLLERDFRQPDMPTTFADTEAARAPFVGVVTFVMLNPSTADALKNDPTVARCCAFAKRWGYKRLHVVNLFALRSTDPRMLRVEADPIGPLTNDYILRAALGSNQVIAAWGVHGVLGKRDEAVRRLLADAGLSLKALGLTAAGHPRHPLYVRGKTEPVPF